MRVLIVSHHPDMRTLLLEVLRAAGHEVVEAQGYIPARWYVQDNPEIACMVVDGADLALEVVSLGPPVLALTCEPDACAEVLVERGCRFVLGKPFNVSSLLDMVERARRVAV